MSAFCFILLELSYKLNSPNWFKSDGQAWAQGLGPHIKPNWFKSEALAIAKVLEPLIKHKVL